MSPAAEHALYCLRRRRRDDMPAKRYRGTWALGDEGIGGEADEICSP
jgi:hypothetical protein